MSQTYTAPPPMARLLERSVATRHLVLVLLFGALTAISAQIKWYPPGNPVPVTAQVFVILLAGAMLGARLGAASQLAYVGFGLLGAPVFAGGLAGPAVLLGPTGGYIIGFILGAYCAGLAAERAGGAALAAGMLAGLGLIYLCGALWLSGWSRLVGGLSWPDAIAQSLTLGVFPFVPWDAIKLVLAYGIARRAAR